ncbi:uncharacterized protein, YkwD family [Paenibacillus sp. 1_12]|uniref:CAP domain-containing protein n=1 Tax=Paenibacillus sp. 1_12 TaxID=1566278 RepID=UPI0008DED866|nr:CAP domain-containing protein [Paenibacillus sp. 1_12]SFK78695.1 uncharacterized protein, YkwD family [Paenibacillus sp. 1_12]
MKALIIIAAILLSAGCTRNDGMTRMQQAKEIRMETPTRDALNGPTQASSIASTGGKQSTITTKQDPFTPPNWLTGDQVPGTSPTTNSGTSPGTNPGTSTGMNPGTYPGTNPGTNPVTNPETNPGTNPEMSPGTGSGTNQGTYPATNPGTSPETNPAVNPADKNLSSPYEQQVLQLVNKQRTGSGLAALMMDNKLSQMALVKAQDMYNNNYFDHTSPTYGSPFQMLDKFQITYSTAGENIAKGQTSPEQVMNEWMNSEGHRANILNNTYTKIGIGYFNGEWVQEFIS